MTPNEGRKHLIQFIEKNFDIKISIDFMGCTLNSLKIKKFIEKVIGELCTEYYDIIKSVCGKLNIYTYEVSIESKAFKIFMAQTFDFSEERIIQQEILKHLMQNEGHENFKEYLKSTPPLNLEQYDTNSYINQLLDFHKKNYIKGEIDDLYAEDVQNY